MASAANLATLEAIYLQGLADETSGDVDAPTGHFYRVGRYVVTTDVQGFRNVETFDTEVEAMAYFEYTDHLYGGGFVGTWREWLCSLQR